MRWGRMRGRGRGWGRWRWAIGVLGKGVERGDRMLDYLKSNYLVHTVLVWAKAWALRSIALAYAYAPEWKLRHWMGNKARGTL